MMIPFLRRVTFVALLAPLPLAALACDDDDDPGPFYADGGLEDGQAKACKNTSGCRNDVCTCATPGKEGTACCGSTSPASCTFGPCDDVCRVCQ